MHPEMSGSRSAEEEPLHCSITSRDPIRFDWQNRWLKGHEYAFMLQNVESYCRRFGIGKYPAKIHPIQIYEQPRNGMLYFVEGKGLGSEFGFPRVQGKKKFRWKKMNFTTDLPKKNPQVTYIVASTTHTHTPQIDDNQQQLFRMHAVIPHQRQNYGPQNSFILCHILQIKRSRQLEGVKNCCKFNNVDFYKLFSFLHNTVVQIK